MTKPEFLEYLRATHRIFLNDVINAKKQSLVVGLHTAEARAATVALIISQAERLDAPAKAFTRDEENGPTLSETAHNSNFIHLEEYTFSDECSGHDYFLVGVVAGIKYYSPNDENWGTIIAIDFVNQLACDTDFFEMNDINGSPEDYALSAQNGRLIRGFEIRA